MKPRQDSSNSPAETLDPPASNDGDCGAQNPRRWRHLQLGTKVVPRVHFYSILSNLANFY